MSGKPLSESAKRMVLSALAFFDAEKRDNRPIIPFDKVQYRVCVALGISLSTVTQVIRESKAGPIRPPKLKRNRPKPVTNIDEFLQASIRRTVHNLYEENKTVSISSILSELKEKDLFHGSKSSLTKIMHHMKFKWKTNNSKRSADFEMVTAPETPAEFYENENTESTSSSTSQEVQMNLVAETSSPFQEFPIDIKTEPFLPLASEKYQDVIEMKPSISEVDIEPRTNENLRPSTSLVSPSLLDAEKIYFKKEFDS